MARINDGGNFGDDPFAKLMAMRQGGSASLRDLSENDQLNQDAIDLASGVMGTVSPAKFGGISKVLGKIVPEAEAAAAPGLKEAIQNAVQNTKVRQFSPGVAPVTGKVSFANEAPQAIGKVRQIVDEAPEAFGKVKQLLNNTPVEETIEPLIPDERRLKLLKMIKEDKLKLGNK